MRDIRKDLQERLLEIGSEKEQLQRRLSNLVENETVLQSLLEQEEIRWKSQQPPLVGLEGLETATKAKGRSPLGRFILETLSDGREWTLDELVALARTKGMIANGKSPKRAIHFSLAGMKQHNFVQMVRSGVWRIVTQETE